MTRDIEDRLRMFTRGSVPIEVDRIALNMDQVEEYSPPPNPAKATDARFESYRRKFGEESWELDALDPGDLNALIVDRVEQVIDWEKREARAACPVVQPGYGGRP